MLSEETLCDQLSWVLESSTVRMAVTHQGGHMAPVSFYRDEAKPVQPYHISPWQEEDHGVPAGRCEAVLRGDFLCLPFGRSELSNPAIPSHGRTASEGWSLIGSRSTDGIHELCIQMEDALHSAKVTRQFFLRDGDNIVYDRATISGLIGEYPVAHHAVIRTPRQGSSLLVSTSRQIFGMTFPGLLGDPEKGEYQSLATGAEFQCLAQVPSIFKGIPDSDCSAFPIRQGFCDLLQIAVEPENGQPAWTAAVNKEDGYLWFSLRNAAILPSTIIWIENRGRHQPPWSGRNCSLGLEDVCSFFDTGTSVSRAPNQFSQRGIRTVQNFQIETPFVLPYVQGVLRTPAEFGRVQSMLCGQRSVTFADASGREVTAALKTGFVFGEPIKE
jgi:hypothetical protein